MRVWAMTDTGLVRKENQDAYAVAEQPITACVVCDGMGGTCGGSLASSIALTAIVPPSVGSSASQLVTAMHSRSCSSS